MRARMALSVADIEYEHREVSLRNKPQAMLEASPKGTVPVFITSAGKVIDESVAVMRHALNRHDPENWMDTNMPAVTMKRLREAMLILNIGPRPLKFLRNGRALWKSTTFFYVTLPALQI
mgnify:CR=1 FL=1